MDSVVEFFGSSGRGSRQAVAVCLDIYGQACSYAYTYVGSGTLDTGWTLVLDGFWGTRLSDVTTCLVSAGPVRRASSGHISIVGWSDRRNKR